MDSTLPRPHLPAPLPLQADGLPAGTVLASRFTLESLVGRGGMGTIYRARDGRSGQPVALKLLHASGPESLQRFSREAAVLAELRHPGIVSYIAHGTVADGRPFLAMEWLEGEDLAQLLARQPLSLEESLTLLRQAAHALALAHHQGVIHRDLKPSNLFLRNGRPEEVVLLDFGLARHVLPSTALTASQMVLGTPGYMAPEQVSALSQLTPSADIFSLGCVLYECLTGKPPFSAPHFVAALAKILFTEPEPLRAVRPELPAALEELVQRMLAKAPERRPPEASSLLAALAQLQARMESEPSSAAPARAPVLPLAEAEQQLVSVLLASPLSSAAPPSGQEDSRRSLLDAVRTLLSPHGAQVELLADGSLVATLIASHGSATDPAALAARCALFLQERWPQAAVVLTTGRGRFHRHLPVGEAMDRAGQLLRQLPPLPPDSAAPVLLDEVTAGLLGPGFQLTRPQPGLFLLQGEQLGADASRPLLGKPTPCVGREQELAHLELAFSTCVQESMAQAILVTAPAGAGKSRLRHEFLRRLERQGSPVLVLLGRGDPMSAGSADGLLAQALRRLCGITGVESLEERRARLAQRLALHLPEAQAQEVVAFLGELCSIPFPNEHSLRLRAARGEPQLMSHQVSRALVAFLLAECAHHPVLLVLEDLHWGDVFSLRLMDEALRDLAEQPFMVLALTRPESEQLLEGPWLRRMQEVPLRGLSRKAGARLVREVLGPQVPDALIDRLVEQAAGNALFLEELIRGVAEGRGETAPETVLAMLQARLMRLEPAARQVLLAASLFGRSFWSGGVQALLGEEHSAPELERRLQRLVELEWIELQPHSRFPEQREYRFRHALVRDAAHELVPENHRPTGHRLAGHWLEQQGESDLRILAEHAAQGQQPERAIHFYTRAAEQLFHRFDKLGLERCMEAALALGAKDTELMRLRALQASTAFWMGDLSKLFELGSGVLLELRLGSLPWYWLINGLYIGHSLGGIPEEVTKLGQSLLSIRPEAEAVGAAMEALCSAACLTAQLGARQESSAFITRFTELCREAAPEAPLEQAWSGCLHCYFSFNFEPQPWRTWLWAEQACRGFSETGLGRAVVTMQALWAESMEQLGDRIGAEARLRDSMALSQQVGQMFTGLYVRLKLALFLAASPEPSQQQEALALVRDIEVDHIDFLSGFLHLMRAKVAARSGHLAEAEAQAHKACELLAAFHLEQLRARVLLSQVLCKQGRASEARHVALLGMQRLEQSGSECTASVGLSLALAEACLAEGDVPAGEAALHSALQRLRACANDIPDKAIRERFLHQVPEHARTLELARQRWGETEPS